jgi:non-heme chloroperoxidase
MIGHSTGGGEAAHYLGRHGTKRVAKAALLGAVPPLLLRTDKDPGGTPLSAFDGLRAALEAKIGRSFTKTSTFRFMATTGRARHFGGQRQSCRLALFVRT